MRDIYLKVLRIGSEKIVAACDAELLGKEFEEGEIVLKASESFYKGRLASLEELATELEDATIANLLGNRVVEEAIRLGYVNESEVVKACRVKHAQVVFL